MKEPLYQPLTELAKGITDKVQESGFFKTVLSVCATSAESVLERLTMVGGFPAAIIVIGPASYDSGNATREVTPGVVVLDILGSQTEDDSERITAAMDTVLNSFPTANRVQPVSIGGTLVTVSGFRPLVLDSRYASYLIELTALQPRNFNKPN